MTILELRKRLLVTVVGTGLYALFMSYRWQHMTEPQRISYQSSFSIITGMLGLFLLVVGVHVALLAAEAARKQARAADQQASAAYAQVDAARAQVVVAEAQTRLTEQSLKEQTRPVLDLVRDQGESRWDAETQQYRMSNVGVGTATKIILHLGRRDDEGEITDLGAYELAQDLVIPPGGTSPIPLDTSQCNEIHIYYSSTTGAKYVSRLAIFKGVLKELLYFEGGDPVAFGGAERFKYVLFHGND